MSTEKVIHMENIVIPKVSRFPSERQWKKMWEQNKDVWSMSPNYSENWIGGTGPRKLYYNTGRAVSGYRAGFEGRYRVLEIVYSVRDDIPQYQVYFMTTNYGLQNDTYNLHALKNRTGCEFKLGPWPVTGAQAFRAIKWQREIGLLRTA